MASLTDQFIALFAGNQAAIGTEEGGCRRLTTPTVDWWRAIDAHLTGEGDPIGVYPMVDDQVHWGCIDFDEGEEESWAHAQNVKGCLELFGVVGWVERSRSKGYHVWVFADSWVPAFTMRKALLAACQIVGAPTKEINPKQETLAAGQLGNYVRLPYPGTERNPAGRRNVIDPRINHAISADSFAQEALASRCTAAHLQPLVDLYTPPPQHTTNVPATPGDPTTLTDRMDGKTWTIWNEGPLDGADRSTTLTKLAHRLREGGQHTYHEALDLLVDANTRWGKQHWKSADVEKYVLRKVW